MLGENRDGISGRHYPGVQKKLHDGYTISFEWLVSPGSPVKFCASACYSVEMCVHSFFARIVGVYIHFARVIGVCIYFTCMIVVNQCVCSFILRE